MAESYTSYGRLRRGWLRKGEHHSIL